MSDLPLDREIAVVNAVADELREANARDPNVPKQRLDYQREIENKLCDFGPRLDGEAEELLDAWMAGVERANDDEAKLGDIRHQFNKLREAVVEAAGNVEDYAPDEMTLAKWRAEENL